ncbi:MAG: hypothetical protein NXI31_00175 [bacterium]|nr:hypothetical protein [bacterium]
MKNVCAGPVVGSALALLAGAVLPTAVTRAQEVSPAFAERAERRLAFRDKKCQEAVHRGIRWLLDHQHERGYWDCDSFMANDPEGRRTDGAGNATQDIGVTGLALLALLAQADAVHADAVRRAADWLVRQQAVGSGRLGGKTHDFVYGHAIATMAIAEAAAMLGTSKYREAAAAGIRYLDSHRNAGQSWRYQPRDSDNDTSITSWCVGAYCAAHDAGIEVSPGPVAEALSWLESMTTHATGHVGYSRRGESSARMRGDQKDLFPVRLGAAMTAAALNSRAMASLVLYDGINVRAAELLLQKPPSSKATAVDFYYWFHATEAMAAVPDRAAQRKWFKLLRGVLLARQRGDDAFAGSWDSDCAWGRVGGRVYSTALGVLMLSSPYRRAHGDLEAMIPDAHPFRRVHFHWQKGEMGAAMAALAAIPVAELDAADLARQRRIGWYCRLHARYCEYTVAEIAKCYPDMAIQYARLGELAGIYAGHEVGGLAAKAAAELEKNPVFAAEIAASKMLAGVLKRYDPKKPPRSRAKRRKIIDRLLKVIDKYPRSKAAEEANQLIQRLDR